MTSNVASPTHPIPSAVTVMPSWQADKYSSKWVTTFLADTAPFFPSSTSWSILVVRTFTIANSVATKNAVKAINTAKIIKLMAVNKSSYFKVRLTPPIKELLLSFLKKGLSKQQKKFLNQRQTFL